MFGRVRKLVGAILGRARVMFGRVRKLVGAILGGATGTVVVAIVDGAGGHISPALAGAIALVLASAGTYLAPKNKESGQ